MFQIFGNLRKRHRTYLKNSWMCTWLIILLFALVLNLGVSAAHRTVLQQGIAEEVLRFHVLANSDDDRDQEIKYMVRDEVLAWMQEREESLAGQKLNQSDYTESEVGTAEKNAEEKEAVKLFLSSHLNEIEQIADGVLARQGVDYRSRASLTKCYFPDRTYGDCTFPAGWYEALRIRLGEAKGHNWWCVLYPGLCFSDCLHAAVPEDELADLKKVLSAEEYESLLRKPEEWKISFRWF